MMPLKTNKECDYIVKNVLAACKDITKLTKAGYNFLYLSSGFIAHYNRHGFIAYYSGNSLSDDILRYRRENSWGNFTPNDNDYDYYMQKRDIYKRIVDVLYKEFNAQHFKFVHITQ